MKSDPQGATAVAASRAGGIVQSSDAGRIEIGGRTMHPLALSFPRLDEDRLGELVEQIRRCGCPPVLHRGDMILGSYDVVRACQIAGVEVNWRQWDGAGSLAETVARAILPAVHLSESQRAAIAVPLSDAIAAETVPAGIRGGSKNLRTEPELGGKQQTAKTAFQANCSVAAQVQRPENVGILLNSGIAGAEEKRLGRSAEIAAKLVSVSPRYVYEARKLRDLDRGLFDDVRAGRMTLSSARVAVSKLARAKKLSPAGGKLGITGRRLAGDDDVLHCGDCLMVMPRLADASANLIFADPPYNNGWKYDGDRTCDSLPDSQYHDWSARWIRHCARLLTADGSIFVVIDARWQSRVDGALRHAGLHWRNTIVWRDPFPIHTDARFQPSARFIHYFTRGPKKFCWNADAVRVPSKRDEIGDTRRVHDRGIVPHDVWDFPRVVGNAHDRVPFEDAPPQLPAALIERCLLAASNPGDRVLDPFCGNGTTWRAARKLGRRFTGIERSKLYAEQATRWANAAS